MAAKHKRQAFRVVYEAHYIFRERAEYSYGNGFYNIDVYVAKERDSDK